jgi:hypothetical protein
MAFLIGPLFSVATGIHSQVVGGKADQDYRNGFTQSQLGIVTAANPGKNVMIVISKHDANKLVNVQQSQIPCQLPNGGTVIEYDCYVFDSGLFVLQGDG